MLLNSNNLIISYNKCNSYKTYNVYYEHFEMLNYGSIEVGDIMAKNRVALFLQNMVDYLFLPTNSFKSKNRNSIFFRVINFLF